MVDIDDILEPILQKTIYLWVLPYACVFMAGFYGKKIWDWVTEPSEE